MRSDLESIEAQWTTLEFPEAFGVSVIDVPTERFYPVWEFMAQESETHPWRP
jgi:hypothetical protein